MIDNIINTIELALLIILPLIIYFQRMNTGYKTYILYVTALYLLWFSTYSLFHELCHIFGSLITGVTINDYQLIPRFWQGDFKNGYVNSVFHNNLQLFISPVSPYVRDIICLWIGYIILKRITILRTFVTGLVLIFFILSPIYDVFNNYFAFVLGARNDFNGIATAIGRFGAHAIGAGFTLAGIVVLYMTALPILKRQVAKV